ncbi:hypothetical protein [Pseudonocardia acidicola]|uniref:Uncharacterized protein n=1 Tax=Pseudonocardia acidicola TaxID=2724939 RepID=A0ABX1S4Q8_9PSEU|nr:hypothetical protein [Pseudonocardia acidicola]NMH96563.1 hypothetical protein [Pseudonocardia acidicola]
MTLVGRPVGSSASQIAVLRGDLGDDVARLVVEDCGVFKLAEELVVDVRDCPLFWVADIVAGSVRAHRQGEPSYHEPLRGFVEIIEVSC